MNTPSGKHGSSAPPSARTQSAPASSNKVATEVDVADRRQGLPDQQELYDAGRSDIRMMLEERRTTSLLGA